MRKYRYTFLDMDELKAAEFTLHLPSDGAAVELANDFLSGSEFSCLELRDDAQFLCRIRKGDAAIAGDNGSGTRVPAGRERKTHLRLLA
jgi:hypothetical protein